MDFTNFKNSVKKEVERRVGENCTVTLIDTIKNNGVVLSGLQIISKNSNVAPVIYLDGYYEIYESGHKEFAEIISDILMVYKRNKVDQSIDVSQFLNYEDVRSNIVYKLINTDKNKELLQKLPHVAFHDLSIVFQVLIDMNDLGRATILIHNKHLGIWNVSIDEIYKDACHNTPIINRCEIRYVEDVVRGIVPPEVIGQMPVQMFILSNKDTLHGAACMIYPDVLKHFSDEMNSSIYIIPSSVHEVLLIPEERMCGLGYELLKQMIEDVNDTQVQREEILSYSLYFYDRNFNEIIRL